MRRILIALLCILLSAPAAAQFNFGVSPSTIEKGTYSPGETFHGQFFVISSSNEDIEVSIETAEGRASDLRRIAPSAVENFSAQPCPDCIEFLRAGGRLTERDRSLDEAGQIRRWRQIEFFVNLPEDIEPGYHLLELTPHPERAGPGGSVGLVSTASVPVLFRVPGEAVRSGRIIGLRAGERTPERQELVGTFYNTGTVTMRVDTSFVLPGNEGNRTFAAETVRVSPGEEARFSTLVDAALFNGSTPVTASASYTTGEAATTRPLAAKQEVTVTGRQEQEASGVGTYLFLVLFLAVSSLVTWRVIRRVR